MEIHLISKFPTAAQKKIFLHLRQNPICEIPPSFFGWVSFSQTEFLNPKKWVHMMAHTLCNIVFKVVKKYQHLSHVTRYFLPSSSPSLAIIGVRWMAHTSLIRAQLRRQKYLLVPGTDIAIGVKVSDKEYRLSCKIHGDLCYFPGSVAKGNISSFLGVCVCIDQKLVAERCDGLVTEIWKRWKIRYQIAYQKYLFSDRIARLAYL